jgi:hypothetical protein
MMDIGYRIRGGDTRYQGEGERNWNDNSKEESVAINV